MAKLLYLEDEQWQVDGTLTIILRKTFSHDLAIVRTISEAECRLKSERFDVVVLDIMLDYAKPIEYANSGFVILEAIRHGAAEYVNSNVAVVVASGVLDATVQLPNGARTTVYERLAFCGIGRERSVLKPFTAEELNAAIMVAMTVKQ